MRPTVLSAVPLVHPFLARFRTRPSSPQQPNDATLGAKPPAGAYVLLGEHPFRRLGSVGWQDSRQVAVR